MEIPNLTQEDILKLDVLKKHATKHIISFDELKKIIEKKLNMEIIHPNHFTTINENYMIGLTIEQQPKAMVRHVSVMVGDGTQSPEFKLVAKILETLDFKEKLGSKLLAAWIENLKNGGRSINLAEIDNEINEKNQ